MKGDSNVTVTAALRVTLRDMTETYVAVAWDRAVPDDHASRTFQNVFAELVLWVEHFYSLAVLFFREGHPRKVTVSLNIRISDNDHKMRYIFQNFN